MIRTLYFLGLAASMIFTFFMSKDNSLIMRFLAAILIGVTWPLSFPVVIVFSFF
ncbi:GhoT/OrtT family toxin [Dickeya oryzae]|nr:GhoT/OrtT family toxin [Dickeya oryzae]MCA6985240.1 GhoT/OrtT family toxin [Dickeya zeae]MBP2848778.1 GhoT/OrtT family toxin [Dickeya oryzae]MBP2856653.1 GhoT/OrtT family toxin [Dickeya oryzae]MCA6990690.1 GhoT/OrtT family toxin [Dickeya oryzae]MCA6993755.1 GhoT/OrtT family toxin [Dickeya oryzae]